MEQIRNTIDVFESLRNKKYKISIENGEELLFEFLPENYHHLAGFQHLTDLQQISKPISKEDFYRGLKNGRINPLLILRSSKYKEIEERIGKFPDLQEITASGSGKIIVEFDRSKSSSDILANYYLYKRTGAPIFGGDASYSILFLGHNEKKSQYYPATFIVEHSPKYIRNQELLDCTIEILEQ